ncbi:Cytochrome P450 [Aspergillus sclerotialis]|uniref:Cytochrome P450 n=1 Tax=Aspergillus sclerotialis TaxID=2070753 RepID=A0A3A2ZJG1_9EURO|nr:Cytochrome P450 [Aspergillus sclerotialis]
MIKGDGAKYIAHLHEKYGEVVRVGPREISYTSASANKVIFGGRPTEETVFEKNPVVWLQGSGEIHNIFFARYREHARYRKMISPAFSEAAIREQEPIIQQFVSQFMDGMRQRSGKACYPNADGVVNIAAWFNFIVYDVLSYLAFGTAIGSLEMGDYHPWVAVIYGAVKHSHYIQAAHRLKPYHHLLERLIPKKISDPYVSHLDFSGKTAFEQKSQQHANVSKANFGSFILKGMTEEELLDNVNILVAAGGDTTVTTLASITYYLIHNPVSYRKLVAEIRETFENEEEITVVGVSHLKYLRAVIQETMRIHPAVPVGLHRVVPKGGSTIDGRWVPGGSWVSVAPVAAYRSPRYWKEPERFIPERWLGDPEFETDQREVCTPFSIGSRSCIGQK